MNFSELKKTINDEIEKGDLSLQVIFNRNIKSIESLKNEGYTYAVIFRKIESKLHEEHLRTLIRNAKKKLKKEKGNNAPEIPSNNLRTSTEINNKTPSLSTEETLNGWYNSLGYKITKRTLDEIIELNLTKQDVIGFNKSNLRQLSNHLNELSRKRKRK